MKRLTRKQLKTDKFAQDVGLTFSFLSEHRSETIRYGLIGLAVVIVGLGIYFYNRHQTDARQEALAAATKIDQAIIGPNPTATNINFTTQAEKDKARTQAFLDLFTKYHGTAEGSVGGIFIGAEKADKGDFVDAEKIYKDVMDSAPSEYSAQARVSLAYVYAAEGKIPEAEKLMRYLIDHPTALISKQEAELELGNILAKSNPVEARKLIEPLRDSPRAAISKAALNAMGNIIAAGKN